MPDLPSQPHSPPFHSASFLADKLAIVLGAGIMQRPLIARAIAQKMHVLVLDKTGQLFRGATTSQKLSAQLLKNSRLYTLPCDFADAQKALADVKQFLTLHPHLTSVQDTARHGSFTHHSPVHCVTTVGTDFSTTVSYLSEKLNVRVPYTPLSASWHCTNKGLMRHKLSQAGMLQPKFVVVRLADSTISPVDYAENLEIAKNAFTSPAALHDSSSNFSTNRTARENDTKHHEKKHLEKYAKRLAELAVGLKWPLVVKPTDSMGARGVIRVDDLPATVFACIKAASFSRSGCVIIEELIQGNSAGNSTLVKNTASQKSIDNWSGEISVDALVCNGKVVCAGIADRHIGGAPFFIESGHTIPSQRSSDVQQLCWQTFAAAIGHLGITHGAAKGDLFLAGKGNVVVGEVAARLSGGYMSGYTYPLSSGIDLMDAMLYTAAGKSVELSPTLEKHRVVVERARVLPPGAITAIANVAQAETVSGVKHLFINQTVGQNVLPAENNLMKFANAIAVGDTLAHAEAQAETALQTIAVTQKI